MESLEPGPARGRAAALAIGLAAALLFVLLAGVRIEAQGPQYDELHQAAGAFTWLGSPPELFCYSFGPLCVLNMSYSAALKTNLYGLWLRLAGRGFRLADWRLFGILIAAAGFPLFTALARAALPAPALALFCALLLTDLTVQVLGRFDWGPVCLALLLRLALLGAWLRGQAAPSPPPGNTFALGALAGFAVFEKLSSCVLALPLAAMVLADPRRRSRRHLVAAAAGLAAGAAPLALVNLGALLVWGRAVSLDGVAAPVDRSPGRALAFALDYLALGGGEGPLRVMLGLAPDGQDRWLEGALALAALLGAGAAALRWGRCSPELGWAGIALAGWAATGIGLFFFPRPTAVHHWILGTPFQYAAVALALTALPRRAGPAGRAGRIAGWTLAAAVALWLGARLPALAAVERALADGRSSRAWHPSLSALGRFAAARADDAVFVASDWGVATQIYCFADGRPGLVHQPFWDYQGPRQIRHIQEGSGKRVLYLVRLDPPADVVPGMTARIEADVAADPRFREVPAEPEAARLAAVSVRKFLFAGARAAAARKRGPGRSPSPPA